MQSTSPRAGQGSHRPSPLAMRACIAQAHRSPSDVGFVRSLLWFAFMTPLGQTWALLLSPPASIWNSPLSTFGSQRSPPILRHRSMRIRPLPCEAPLLNPRLPPIHPKTSQSAHSRAIRLSAKQKKRAACNLWCVALHPCVRRTGLGLRHRGASVHRRWRTGVFTGPPLAIVRARATHFARHSSKAFAKTKDVGYIPPAPHTHTSTARTP